MRITNSKGSAESWVIDMKKASNPVSAARKMGYSVAADSGFQEGKVVKIENGSPKIKPDVTINLTDDVFQQLSDGKLNGQKICLHLARSEA